MSDYQPNLEELTALDWIAVLLSLLGSVFCFQFPFGIAPHFEQMFVDFGSQAHLSTITKLGLTTWFPFLLGAVPLGCLAAAMVVPSTLPLRRALIVGSFMLALSACGICLYAVYAPVLQLAGKIQAACDLDQSSMARIR